MYTAAADGMFVAQLVAQHSERRRPSREPGHNQREALWEGFDAFLLVKNQPQELNVERNLILYHIKSLPSISFGRLC